MAAASMSLLIALSVALIQTPAAPPSAAFSGQVIDEGSQKPQVIVRAPQ